MKPGRQVTRIRRTAAALSAGTLLAIAAPAVANAACAGGPVSHPFARFGDNANYVPAPSGTFESGTSGWALSASEVVDGNETFAESGSHSLAIEANGRAVSPPVCVGSEYPTFRFFARQLSGGSQAKLTASLRWVDLLGIAVESPAGSVPPGDVMGAQPDHAFGQLGAPVAGG